MKNMMLCGLMVVGVIGCGGDESTSAPTSVPATDMAVATAGGDMASASQVPMTAAVTVGPNNTLSYAPATVDIAAGGTVTWTWAAGITMPHTVTSGDTPAAFASSPIQMSGTFQATFPRAGTFHYFCMVHGAAVMSGVVNVH